jgi:hypothetical protein
LPKLIYCCVLKQDNKIRTTDGENEFWTADSSLLLLSYIWQGSIKIKC